MLRPSVVPYLSVIGFAGGEQRIQGIVGGDGEPGKVDEEFASDVEEHEEEVDSEKTEESVDLGDGGLLLEVDKRRILGKLEVGRLSAQSVAQLRLLERLWWASTDMSMSMSMTSEAYLLVNLRDMVLSAILERHCVV